MLVFVVCSSRFFGLLVLVKCAYRLLFVLVPVVLDSSATNHERTESLKPHAASTSTNTDMFVLELVACGFRLSVCA